MKKALFVWVTITWLSGSSALATAQPSAEPLDESPEPTNAEVAVDPPAASPPAKIVSIDSPPPPPPPPDAGLGDCTFFPDPICPHSIVAELSFGMGQNLSNIPPQPFVVRTFLEVGYLTPAPFPREFVDIHVGPIFALAVETSDIPFAWVASPRVRARWFVAGTHFVVEHSVGPQFQRFVYHEGLETGTRVGFAADLSFGYRGIAGPWAELSVLGDPGGNDGAKLQWLAGVRANLLGWATAFAAMGEAIGR